MRWWPVTSPAGPARARRGAAVLAAGALTVAVLAGCGSTADTRSPPSGPELGGALRAWSRFPVNASPRRLVLVGPEVSDPAAGFPDGAIKLAYLRRAVRFPARLPPGPATAGGFQLISARQAVALFRSGAATGPPAGTRLTVTTVRLGTGVFVTDRGLRRLPTWQFGFAGVRGLAAVLAVAAARIFSPPTPAGGRPPFVDWAFLGPGGRVLTVRFTGAPAGRGPCTAGYSVRAASSATAVAIAVTEHPHGSGNVACAAVGYRRQVTTRLPAPRRTPICDGLDGETFWLVSQRGRDADWVQNIEANPRVRIKVSGLRTTWRTGTAHILTDDDPGERLRLVGRANPARKVCVWTTQALNTSPLTVRIDLDPQ